ncbi:MAG: hypothetical protein AAFR81_25505 [Chloroflexota bacterium]
MSETQKVDLSDGRIILYNAGGLGVAYLLTAIGFVIYSYIEITSAGANIPQDQLTLVLIQSLFGCLGIGVVGMIYGAVIGRFGEQLFQSDMATPLKWGVFALVIAGFTAAIVVAFVSTPLFLIGIPVGTALVAIVMSVLAMRPRKAKAPKPPKAPSPDEPAKAKLPTVDFKK